MMKKIKGNPPKTEGRCAPRTRKKPFRLEVGKTYETRNGKFKAKILRETDDVGDAWPFEGEWIGRVPAALLYIRSPWWTPTGGIGLLGVVEPTDLVREVPGAERPRSRKAKGSK